MIFVPDITVRYTIPFLFCVMLGSLVFFPSFVMDLTVRYTDALLGVRNRETTTQTKCQWKQTKTEFLSHFVRDNFTSLVFVTNVEVDR